jgi:hypothetical protein
MRSSHLVTSRSWARLCTLFVLATTAAKPVRARVRLPPLQPQSPWPRPCCSPVPKERGRRGRRCGSGGRRRGPCCLSTSTSGTERRLLGDGVGTPRLGVGAPRLHGRCMLRRPMPWSELPTRCAAPPRAMAGARPRYAAHPAPWPGFGGCAAPPWLGAGACSRRRRAR